ncbi:hypothetical protein CPHLJ_7g1920 [Cryptosporidium parvum]|uniref:GINS subunit domain-containing protein n=3 Tax=Cryptosporidium TaxID=5806 RepID=A0A7S7RF52_CRYPV|nr:Complex protein GINS subunit domain A [Cryptosporidium parvum]WKS78879.1 hypothetical protein CPCDC_7g1920 [Cryptosporidium sp. 43IA8]|eukprot:QOY40509.1 hypothetical protein CPATCC_003367 [Cryptosporidium parvum]
MAEESLDLIEEFIKTRDELQKRSFSSVDWDVDYILMNETLLPCRMALSQKECAFMCMDSQLKENNEILAGEILQLPIWLARELYSRGFVGIDYPDFLSSKMSNALRTDPCSVDLNNISPYFFQVSVIFLGLLQDELFLKVILESFRSRLEKLFLVSIYLHLPNSSESSKMNNDHTQVFLKSLTSIEKDMLEESSISYFQSANALYCRRVK